MASLFGVADEVKAAPTPLRKERLDSVKVFIVEAEREKRASDRNQWAGNKTLRCYDVRRRGPVTDPSNRFFWRARVCFKYITTWPA